jgi:hypothetical protein
MQTNRNTLSFIAFSGIAACVLATPLAAVAQNTAAPPIPPGFKVILNNDHVRVFESTFAPDVAVPMMNYPRRTMYVLKGASQFKYSYPDGKTETIAQNVGDVRSLEPGRMSITNVGANEAVVLVVIDKRDMAAQR